jgi:16S rRNA (guanine966-N2)-methyltransferase
LTFVEQNRRAIALIRENLAACGGDQRYTIDSGDVAVVLRRATGTFDLILLDPPYDLHAISDALEAAADRLAADGLIVLERATRREPEVPAVLRRVRDVKSGDSTLTFLAHA